MNHATTYHIGNYQQTRKEKRATAISTVGQLCTVDAKANRSTGIKKGQKKVRTDKPTANGFLKATFLPRLKETKTTQAPKRTKKLERDFYKSLSRLAGHYGIETMQTQDYGYPYNMALALWDIETKLKRTVRDWDNIRLVEDGRKTFFISEERYDTGTSLYYIPVLPLYLMLKSPKRKYTAQLLLSVCAYLYNHANISYYRQQDSYLYWQHEILLEWLEYDDQTEETEIYLSELRQAEWVGERMGQKIFNRNNLKVFKERLDSFRSNDEFDNDCWLLACKAFELYTDYPNENIFRNAKQFTQDPEDNDCYDSEVIWMDKYISFYADGKGWLHDTLLDVVNNEFNECSELQEPYILKRFDGSKLTDNNLDFEYRLFNVVDDLCSVLNNYKHTEL